MLKPCLVASLCLAGSVALAQTTIRIQPFEYGFSERDGNRPQSLEDYYEVVNTMTRTIPNKESNFWCTSFNWGDDEIMNVGNGNSFLSTHMDRGDNSWWYQDAQNFLHTDSRHAWRSTDKFSHSLEHAWSCINLVNIALENIGEMTDGSDEERDRILGQLYYYRAWWHEQLMEYYGAMPYIDYVLETEKIVKVQIPLFRESAMKCAADFERAAELLPAEWRHYAPGNEWEKVTKLAAQAYAGKVLLWAASPLHHLGAQTGALANGKTYEYDKELAERAAALLGSALTSVMQGETPYALAEFRFGDSMPGGGDDGTGGGNPGGGDDNITPSAWQNELSNSELDPNKSTECFIVHDAEKDDEPATVLVGEGPNGKNAIMVKGKVNAVNPWDTQFFVYTPNKKWKAGEQYRFHMWYKASKPIDADTQVHGTPGKYMHWAMLNPNPSFTTEWQEKTWEGRIPNEGNSMQQSIAFSLNKNVDMGDPGTEYDYFFSDITWESYSPDRRRCIVVETDDMVEAAWDSQFWVVANEPFHAGDTFEFTAEVRADKAAASGTQIHGKEPGSYMHWSAVGNVNFTTEWQTFSSSGTIPAGGDGGQSIAFNLNDFEAANHYMFSYISLKINGREMVNNGDLQTDDVSSFFKKEMRGDVVNATIQEGYEIFVPGDGSPEPEEEEDQIITTVTYADGNFPFYPMGCEPPVIDGAIHFEPTGEWSQFFISYAITLTPGDYAAILHIKSSKAGTITLTAQNGWSGQQLLNGDVNLTGGDWEDVMVRFNGITCSPSANYDFILKPATFDGVLDVKSLTIVKNPSNSSSEENPDQPNQHINHKDIYDHVRGKGVTNFYTDIFYTTQQGWKNPGAQEAIMHGYNPDINGSNWTFAKTWGPKMNSIVEHDKVIHMPTANYVNYAYGMENGLPLDDPDSGFDPTHPFQNRDPRFYHDIVFDGFQYINSLVNDNDKDYQFAQLYTGGNMRDEELGSRTGYFTQKLVPHTANKYDHAYDWQGALQCYLSYMRLAEVYLMYAEACAAYGSATTSNNCSLTAAEAINVLRDRVGAGHVAEKYLTDNRKFMDEIRRERACELAFEGHRWGDLSRWLLLTEEPYNKKTSQEFHRVSTDPDDPCYNEVSGWSEQEILTRQLDASHYTFPVNPNDPPEIEIIYSEDLKTLIYYPRPWTDSVFVIPSHVEVLGEGCFSGCSALKQIIGHDGIVKIEKNAFNGSGITSFELPALITELPEGCFEGTALKEFTIPARITKIGAECFADCDALKTITIEEGVESIGDLCFQGDYKLQEINLPASVKSIGEGAFKVYRWATSGSLRSINVAEGNQNYTSADGILYNKDQTRLIAVPSLYSGELVVPATVTEMADYSIQFCSKLTKLTLPENLKSMGEMTLDRCMQLSELTCLGAVPPAHTDPWMTSNFMLGSIVMYVPAESFEQYKKEFEHTYAEIYPIGQKPVYEANDLVLIADRKNTFPTSLFEMTAGRWIGREINGMYVYNESDPSIVSHLTGASVNDIEMDITDWICTIDLKDGGEPAMVLSIPHEVWAEARKVVFHTDGQITDTHNGALYGNAYKVQLPASVKTINAFNFMYQLTFEVVMNVGVETIEAGAFLNYQDYSIDIPKTVSYIAPGACFSSEVGALNVDPENPYFTSVDGVLYSKDMTELVAYPYNRPASEYIVPESVTMLGARAFAEDGYVNGENSNIVQTLVLPAGITYIGDSCFARKTLDIVCYAKEVPALGADVFYRSTGMEGEPVMGTLYVLDELLDDYKIADQWKDWYRILPISQLPFDPSSVTMVESDAKAVLYGIYSIDGTRNAHLQPGLNIVKMSDGSVRKVMMQK